MQMEQDLVTKNKFLTVALPISSFLPAKGGAEIGLHNIASILVKNNHRPVVISSYAHIKALRKLNLKLPYEVIAYPPKLLTFRQTARPFGKWLLQLFHQHLQSRYHFDVWHATIGYPIGISVVEFCKKKNIAHIVRCVGEDIQIQPEIGYGMRLNPEIDKEIRSWLPKAQKLVAITQSVSQEYIDLGCSPEQIEHVPNGIDLPRFLAHEHGDVAQLRLKEKNKFTFLVVGRNHPKKNFAQLVEAAAALAKTTKEAFEILIVGTGVSELQGLVDQYNVCDLVTLIEPTNSEQDPQTVPVFPSDDILDYYMAADCFVMPSLIETFGIVVAEAMGGGLPVIAANSPGCRDVIRNGQDGLIYPGDLKSLVDAMQQVLENQTLREDLVTRSKQRVHDFDWNSIVMRYIHLYKQVISDCSNRNELNVK